MNGELDAVNGSIEEREDTMYDYLDHVAIIGAGLGVCSTLSLHYVQYWSCLSYQWLSADPDTRVVPWASRCQCTIFL